MFRTSRPASRHARTAGAIIAVALSLGAGDAQAQTRQGHSALLNQISVVPSPAGVASFQAVTAFRAATVSGERALLTRLPDTVLRPEAPAADRTIWTPVDGAAALLGRRHTAESAARYPLAGEHRTESLVEGGRR